MTKIIGNVFCVHGLEDNIVEMSTLSKAIHRFSTNPIKIPMSFFHEKRKIWNVYGTAKNLNSQNNSEQK